MNPETAKGKRECNNRGMGFFEFHSYASPVYRAAGAQGAQPSVLEASGGLTLLLTRTALCCVFFTAVKFLVAPVLISLLPPLREPIIITEGSRFSYTFDGVDKKRTHDARTRAPFTLETMKASIAQEHAKSLGVLSGYFSAVLHHLWVAPVSIYALGVLYSSQTEFPYDWVLSFPPLTLAYLVCDTLFYAVPYWDMEFLVHHSATMLVSILFILAPVTTLRWTTSLTLCELSSIPLCVSYFCVKLGAWNSSPVKTWAERAFGVAFLLTRVVNLPIAVYSFLFLNPKEAAALGPVGAALLAVLCLLQFWWFYKICLKFLPPAKRGKGSD